MRGLFERSVVMCILVRRIFTVGYTLYIRVRNKETSGKYKEAECPQDEKRGCIARDSADLVIRQLFIKKGDSRINMMFSSLSGCWPPANNNKKMVSSYSLIYFSFPIHFLTPLLSVIIPRTSLVAFRPFWPARALGSVRIPSRYIFIHIHYFSTDVDSAIFHIFSVCVCGMMACTQLRTKDKHTMDNIANESSSSS